jgi:hypothetical protein
LTSRASYFHPRGSISVEGRWELLDQKAEVLDRSLEPSERTDYRLNRILGKVVAGTQVGAPRSVSLTFENGCVLRLFDDDPRYEAFSIQLGDGRTVTV